MTAVVVALVALAVLAAGALVRWATLVAVGLAGAAFAYAIALHRFTGSARPLSAVLAAALLLVVGELGFGLVGRAGGLGGGLTLRRPGRRVTLRLGACAVGAAACAVVVLGAASLPLAGSLAATAIGTVAAVIAVWLLVTAVRADVDDR